MRNRQKQFGSTVHKASEYSRKQKRNRAAHKENTYVGKLMQAGRSLGEFSGP